MITLKIDGQAVEIDQKINPAITVEIAAIEDPENSSSGYSKTVEVPFTPRNRRIFGFVNELFSREQFNNALHTAEYADDDTVIMCGIAQLEKFSYVAGADGQVVGGSFHVSVVGASFEWITNARKPVNELDGGEVVKYTMEEVYKNSVSRDPSLIKFFPVDRGAFWKEGNEGEEPRTALSIYDYHPFLNVWGLMKLIFGKWNIRTSMQTMLEKLYFSGTMPQVENLEYLKEENDFKCGTTLQGEERSAMGGFSMELFDKFDSDGYFIASEGLLFLNRLAMVVYQPTAQITVGFDLNIVYEATVSRTGEYFGQLVFSNRQALIEFTPKDSEEAKNPVELSAIEENADHFICLTFENPAKYKRFGATIDFIIYEDDSNPINPPWPHYYSHSVPLIDHIYKAEHFAFAQARLGFHLEILEKLVLWLETQDGKLVKLKDATDVAVTMFEPGMMRTLMFDRTVHTPAYVVTPSTPVTLSVEFRTVEPNENTGREKCGLTLGVCELTPNFQYAIGEDVPVGVSMVGGDDSQLDFLASVRQMFNLMFYTNPLTKEVFMESRSSFYNLDLNHIDDLVDWRDKIDYSKEIIIEELGADVGNCLKLAYNDGNEVIERYNWKNQTLLGSYSVPLLNKTSDDEQEIINPTFAPFLLREVASVGMVLPQEKSEKTRDRIEEIDLDITPIIGQFTQIKRRTAGTDRGDYPEYPQLVFQDVTAGANLGFDDLQASPPIPGLNQYYQGNISAYNYGRRLTVSLKLEPQDIEAILLPNASMRDFRGIFLLRHDGEDVPCMLEGISDYNPMSGASVKCQFIVDPNIQMYENGTVITYNGIAIAYKRVAMKYRKKGLTRRRWPKQQG